MPQTFITAEEIRKLRQALHNIDQLIPQYCPNARTYLENDLHTFDEVIATVWVRIGDVTASADTAL
jgi:hypothetical protein